MAFPRNRIMEEIKKHKITEPIILWILILIILILGAYDKTIPFYGIMLLVVVLFFMSIIILKKYFMEEDNARRNLGNTGKEQA